LGGWGLHKGWWDELKKLAEYGKKGAENDQAMQANEVSGVENE
jgi:hypothetical protein